MLVPEPDPAGGHLDGGLVDGRARGAIRDRDRRRRTAAAINLFWQGEALTCRTRPPRRDSSRVAIAVVIAAGAVAQNEVNSRSVAGAICVYMLFGMLFMFLYGVLATLGHAPFFAQGTDGTRALRLYFSFTTLATLGYGDYTAAGNLGHALAVLEALIGQLYLVTVVAVVVTRLGTARAQTIAADSGRESAQRWPSNMKCRSCGKRRTSWSPRSTRYEVRAHPTAHPDRERAAAGRRLPAGSRRADAGRQRAAEPRDVREAPGRSRRH